MICDYLLRCHNGDVCKRYLVGFEKADAKVQGGHAFRMMGAYERWLRQQGEEGARQLAVLHLLGLFDRPADPGCIDALRQKPPIESLTEPLIGLGEDDWNYTLSNLRECGLIAIRHDESAIHSPQFAIDTHPLVREYFDRQLRDRQPRAWQAAHRRLYEHLCATTTDRKDQPTLEDLQPLYQAVAHACHAGMHPEAYNMYRNRILRGQDYYSTKKLGAPGQDLAALAGFFEQLWVSPHASLSDQDKAEILNLAGHRLRAIGRIRDALQPMRVSIDLAESKGYWKPAAIAAGSLSSILLLTGDLQGALECGKRSLALADQSADHYQMVSKRTTIADALHHLGRFDESLRLFEEAEALQRSFVPNFPFLASRAGYRYCELLLSLKRYSEVRERVTATLTWRVLPFGAVAGLHDEALDNLSLANALLAEKGPTMNLHQILEVLNRAVEGLRRAGTTHHLPRGLLSRAAFYVAAGQPVLAESDLEEAERTVQRERLDLYMTDIHLSRARLFRDKEELEKARAMIEQCYYWRRREELENAEEAARGW